jgi:hypothetical protein
VGAQVDINQAVWTSAGGYDDGRLRVYCAMFDGTTLSVRINRDPATAAVVSIAPGQLVTNKPAHVGGQVGGQVVLGDIAEVLVLSRDLADSEYARTYAYLAAKYGL